MRTMQPHLGATSPRQARAKGLPEMQEPILGYAAAKPVSLMRVGREWAPRHRGEPEPKVCAKCKSKLWNKRP